MYAHVLLQQARPEHCYYIQVQNYDSRRRLLLVCVLFVMVFPQDWWTNIQNLPKSRLLYNIKEHLFYNTAFAFAVSMVHALTPQHIIDDLHVSYPHTCGTICVHLITVCGPWMVVPWSGGGQPKNRYRFRSDIDVIAKMKGGVCFISNDRCQRELVHVDPRKQVGRSPSLLPPPLFFTELFTLGAPWPLCYPAVVFYNHRSLCRLFLPLCTRLAHVFVHQNTCPSLFTGVGHPALHHVGRSGSPAGLQNERRLQPLLGGG